MVKDLDETLSFESLDALLGVIVEVPKGRKARAVACGERAPAERRHTEWNNFAAFSFGGYVARVTKLRCECCEEVTDILEGIFIEEVHLPSGSRKLTRLATNGDWPIGGGHRREIEHRDVRFCAQCIGVLGFDKVTIVEVPQRTLVKES